MAIKCGFPGREKQIHVENITDLFEHLLMDFVSFTQGKYFVVISIQIESR